MNLFVNRQILPFSSSADTNEIHCSQTSSVIVLMTSFNPVMKEEMH